MSLLSLSVCFSFSKNIFAHGLGITPYPIAQDRSVLTTELTGLVSNGRGMGMQARYTRKIQENLQVEGGFGFSDGDRQNSLFMATNLELFPDYGSQPKIIARGFIEHGREQRSRKTVFGLGPLVTKEFRARETSLHPFVAVPVGLTLNQSNNTYRVRTHLSLGLTGEIPFEGMQNLLYNVEGNVNIQNSYSMVYLGLSYPFN